MGKIRTGIRSIQVTDNKRGGTTAFDVKANVSIELSGDERTTLESANNPAAGASVKSSRGRWEVTVIDAGDLSIEAIQGWEDITAVAVGANGKTYTLDGWQVEKVTVDMIEGDVPIVLEGISTEQTFG